MKKKSNLKNEEVNYVIIISLHLDQDPTSLIKELQDQYKLTVHKREIILHSSYKPINNKSYFELILEPDSYNQGLEIFNKYKNHHSIQFTPIY